MNRLTRRCKHSLENLHTAAEKIVNSYPTASKLKPHEQIEMVMQFIRRYVRFKCRPRYRSPQLACHSDGCGKVLGHRGKCEDIYKELGLR